MKQPVFFVWAVTRNYGCCYCYSVHCLVLLFERNVLLVHSLCFLMASLHLNHWYIKKRPDSEPKQQSAGSQVAVQTNGIAETSCMHCANTSHIEKCNSEKEDLLTNFVAVNYTPEHD